MEKQKLLVPGAILIAGILISTSLLFGERYSTFGHTNRLWRIDHLTGDVVLCVFYNDGARCQRVDTRRNPFDKFTYEEATRHD